MSPSKSLTRSHSNVMIGGVCGGIAQWLGWDPTLVRILYVLAIACLAAFPAVSAYIVLYMVMPEEPV